MIFCAIVYAIHYWMLMPLIKENQIAGSCSFKENLHMLLFLSKILIVSYHDRSLFVVVSTFSLLVSKKQISKENTLSTAALEHMSIVKVITKRQICEILSKEILSLKRNFLSQKIFRPQRYFLAVWEHSPLKETPHTTKITFCGAKNFFWERNSNFVPRP